MKKEKILAVNSINYTLFYLPNDTITPYVAAWGYNPKRDSWGQGHYFSKKLDALHYMVSIAKERRWM